MLIISNIRATTDETVSRYLILQYVGPVLLQPLSHTSSFSLLSEPRLVHRLDHKLETKVEPREEVKVEAKVEAKVEGRLVSGEQKVVMANRAGRLLKTVKLLLAREKSYDLSSAEGRKGGRRLSKSSSMSSSR